jgi:type 1 fimbria pilin
MSRISIVAMAASLAMASPAFASALYPSQALQNPVPPGARSKHKGGIVSATGSIVGGTGYSVSHDGTGEYTIDVPAGFFGTTCPVILVTPAGQNGQTPIPDDFNYITCGGAGEVKMQIRIRGRQDGTLQDNAFHFLMMVP